MDFNIPRVITKNDSVEWRDRATTKLSTDWTLTYHIRGSQQLDITGEVVEDGWKFEETFELAAGLYQVQVAAYKAASRQTLSLFTIEITADLSEITEEYDPRTDNEIRLQETQDAIAAILQSHKQGSPIREYVIGTRRMQYQDSDKLLTELRKMEKYYSWAVAREKRNIGVNQSIMRF